MTVYRREDWNEIISEVNDLASNPDSGCDPVEELELVGPDHRWAKSDPATGIQEVQDKLMEICPENEFSGIPDLWKQSIIDEIQEAIANGWCECETCKAENETFILFEIENRCTFGGLIQVNCTSTSPATPPAEDRFPQSVIGEFDWYTAATAVTGFGVGIGGNVQVVRQTTSSSGTMITTFLYVNNFDCQGAQKLPLPTMPVNSAGNLPNSLYIGGQTDGVNCSNYYRRCVLGFCIDTKCSLGLPACDGRDGSDIPALLAAKAADCDGSLITRYQWVARKNAPSQFHGDGASCLECCEDNNKGFVGIDCPDPDEEEEP